MVAQSPPYAVQNGSHSAQLFRMAAYSPWRQPGIVNIADFAITAQSTPNMSVVVAAGRAWIKGTQVANVTGAQWTTQGGYYGFNDAPVTLTIASADPTNPRIDAVVAYATDSFYSGASNTFVLGVVTGTPAATPATPAVPNNGILLGTVAVAANATSIVSGNITAAAGLMTVARGGVLPVTATDTTGGEYTGMYRDHPTRGAERWDGGQWTTVNPFTWTDLLRSTTYNYSVPVGAAYADLQSGNFTVTGLPPGREVDFEWKVPQVGMPGSTNLNLRLMLAGVTADSLQFSTGASANFVPGHMTGSIVVPSGGSVLVQVQGYAGTNAVALQAGNGASAACVLRYRVR